MAQYPKLFLLLLIVTIGSNRLSAQALSNCLDKKLHWYMVLDKKSKTGDYLIQVLIYNDSRDSILLKNISKTVYHKSMIASLTNEERELYWDLLTISDRVPDDAISVLPFAPSIKIQNRNNTFIDLSISPQSIFKGDFLFVHSSFVVYQCGFYKLCLYCCGIDTPIAEIIVETR